MTKEGNVRFRKNYPLEYGLFVAALAVLTIFFCVLSGFWILRDNRRAKEKNVDDFSMSLDSYLYNLDNLSLLFMRDGNLRAFRELTDVKDAPPADVISARNGMRYYGTVLGMYGRTYIYFAVSDSFFSADGFFTRNGFFTETNLPQTGQELLGGVLSGTGQFKRMFSDGGDRVFYVQHYALQNYYTVCLLENALFADLAETFFAAGEGVAVSMQGQSVYTRGRLRGVRLNKSFKNFETNIEYHYTIPMWSVVGATAGLTVFFVLLYFVLYRVIDRLLCRYYRKVQNMTLASDLDIDVQSASVLSLLKSFVASSSEKEAELKAELIDSGRLAVSACLKAWILGAEEDALETERTLALFGLDLSGFHSVISFNDDTAEADTAGFVRILRGVYLYGDAELPQFTARCGISNAHRRLDGLKRAYSESRQALKMANLFSRGNVLYCDLAAEEPQEELLLPLKTLEADLSGGCEVHVAAADELIACCRMNENALWVLRVLSRAQEIVNDVRQSYNLESEEFALPPTATIAEAGELLRNKLTRYSEQLKTKLASKYAYMFAEIKAYVDENLVDKDLSLKKAAAHFGCSVSYISRIFSENGEENYNEYVSRRRIELGKRLLLENKPIAQIAEMCGFNSDTSFRRVFIKQVKVTPNKYKTLKYDSALP